MSDHKIGRIISLCGISNTGKTPTINNLVSVIELGSIKSEETKEKLKDIRKIYLEGGEISLNNSFKHDLDTIIAHLKDAMKKYKR